MNAAQRDALRRALIEVVEIETLAHRQLLDVGNMQTFLDTQTGLLRAQMEKAAVTKLRIENALAHDDAAMIGGGTLHDIALAAKEEASR